MDKDINEYVKNEILLHSENGYVTKREGKTLEFKEKFGMSSLPQYAKIMASYANNIVGFIIFGV